MKIKLTGAKTYLYQGVRYEAGKVYEVSDAVGDDLLDKVNETEENYFQLARDKDGPAEPPKAPPLDPVGKAPAKKATKAAAAKKTIKLGGGKIEGLDDDDGEDDRGDPSDPEVPV